MAETTRHTIDLTQKESDDVFDVVEELIFGFFTARSFKLKTGLPFNIGAIVSGKTGYIERDMNLENVLRFTEYFPTGDERPFLVCIEDTHETKSYYWVRFVTSTKFKAVNELNSTGEEVTDEKLLDVMKTLFSKFYESVIAITEAVIEARKYKFYDIVYSITRDGTRVHGYETYRFEPDKTHSVDRILHEGEVLQIDGDIRFVKYFTFFFAYNDLSAPLLIETFDYGIGNTTPEYNYYKQLSPTSTRWVQVECATKMTHPKCSNDLEMLLNDIVQQFREIPLSIHLLQKGLFNGQTVTTKFSGIPLLVQLMIEGSYVSYTYWTRLTRSFFVEGLYLHGVKLNIDLSSLKIFGLYVITNPKDNGNVVLICVGLHTESSGSEHRFKWFEPVKLGGLTWLPSQFRANPEEDTEKIEAKIKSFYEVTRVEEPSSNTMLYIVLIVIGIIIGVILGVRYARALMLYIRRAYNRAYRRLP